MEYYCCKCYSFNDEYILCKECSTWVDNVETTVEKKHLNEFKPVVHAKIWNKNQNQKILMFIYMFIIE